MQRLSRTQSSTPFVWPKAVTQISGAVGPVVDGEPIFIGSVLGTWTVLSDDEQKKIAGGIRDELGKRRVLTASVYDGPAVVVQISGGRVLFVQ